MGRLYWIPPPIKNYNELIFVVGTDCKAALLGNLFLIIMVLNVQKKTSNIAARSYIINTEGYKLFRA